MSMLTYVLPRIVEIVSLSGALKLEYKRFTDGDLDEGELIANTSEVKSKLFSETEKLAETVKILGTSNKELLNCCSDLTRRINSQANRVSRGLQSPLNIGEVLNGLQEIDAHLQLLENALCAYYDEIGSRLQKESVLSECYKKVFHAVKRRPPPIFEDDTEDYDAICSGVKVEYAKNERFVFNRRMLQFPGIVTCVAEMIDAKVRERLLTGAREYDPSKASSINPLTNEIINLLPCINIVDLGFSSEDELKSSYVQFFKDGNWLEAYVYFMLDRAGCSTRLLNVKLVTKDFLLEVDVAANFRNNLVIFEVKDRSNSNDLSENDLVDITQQLEKVARIGNIKTIYIINSRDEHKDRIREAIEGIASEKGASVEILFLENSGIDNLATKIRSCLR